MISTQAHNYNTPLAHISSSIQDIVENIERPTISSLSSKHKILTEIVKKHKLSASIESTLRARMNCSDEHGESSSSQNYIAKKRRVSVRTIRRHDALLEKLGIISIERQDGWQQTNKVTILAIQHWNPHKEDKMSSYLLDLHNLKDLNNNIAYEEHVCSFNNLQKKEEITPKPKHNSKHISETALASDRRHEEILRVCMAWLLTDKQTEEIVVKMRCKGIQNQARYLASLCSAYKEGRMSTREDIGYSYGGNFKSGSKQPAKPSKPTISAEQRKEINEWAEKKAYERARELGKVRSDTDYDKMRQFDAFISNETINFEKQAFLKIQSREDSK